MQKKNQNNKQSKYWNTLRRFLIEYIDNTSTYCLGQEPPTLPQLIQYRPHNLFWLKTVHVTEFYELKYVYLKETHIHLNTILTYYRTSIHMTMTMISILRRIKWAKGQNRWWVCRVQQHIYIYLSFHFHKLNLKSTYW